MGNCLGFFILFSIGNETPIPSMLNTTMPQNSKNPITSFHAGISEIFGAVRWLYTIVATTQVTENITAFVQDEFDLFITGCKNIF